jgi:hypothetical protein
MFTPKNPYGNLSSAAFGASVAGGAKALGKGIEKLGRVIAKPMAKDEAELARADAAAKKDAEKKTAQKNKRAADTRWKNKQHQDSLKRNQELADQRAANQKQLDAQRTEAAVDRTTKVAQAKKPATAAKPAAPAAKPAAPKSASRKTASGVSTDKDGVLKPAVSKNKSAPKSQPVKAGPKLDTKAGDAYND